MTTFRTSVGKFVLDNGRRDVHPARPTVAPEVFEIALMGYVFGGRALPHGVRWVED